MNSKEISRKSGLPISTIRYYEKIELIPSPLRKSNGYRDYDEDVLFLLRIIKELTYLGFSLREIKELLNFIQIHSNISDNLDYIQDILEQKNKEILERQVQLKLISNQLADIKEKEKFEGCPIKKAVKKILNIFLKKA